MAGHSEKAVYTAIIANSLVMVAKTAAWVMTGSPAMLSEAMHSLADVGNQSLLALGIHKSGGEATEAHPYGFARDRFIWALISAVGIFFLGCGVTLVYGTGALLHPTEHGDSLVLLASVLVFSLVVEGYSLWVAVQGIHALKGELGFFAYLKQTSDPMVSAVFLEDTAAVFGVVLAAVGITLAHLTGEPRWDALSSIAIGLLLGYVAVALVRRNRTLLLGQAPPDEMVRRIEAVIRGHEEVEKIKDVKALVVGSGSIRFKAEVDFDGRVLARRLLDGKDLDALAQQLSAREGMEALLCDFGEEVVTELGRSVDRIVEAVRAEVPEVEHADLETD